MAKEDEMTTKVQRKVSLAVLETTRETLEAIPPAPKEMREVGIGEVLRALTPTIRKLLAKGYSKTKVIELLNEQGVPATLTSLREYFRLRPVRQVKEDAAPPSAREVGGRSGARPSASAESGRPVSGAPGGGTAEEKVGSASIRRPASAQQPAEQHPEGSSATGGLDRRPAKAS
jgi:hypothetical protein